MIWLQVAESDGQPLAARVSVAFGTRVARADDPPGDYETGARVVLGAFETLAADALPLAESCGCVHPWNTVAVVSVRPAVVRELRHARATQVSGRDREEGRRLVERAVDAWMQSSPEDAGWRAEGPPEACGFSSEPRPREHTTVNQKTGRRVGLHLDSWDQLAPRERWRGSNRICVNLGTAPRALVFVAQSASGFADDLLGAGIDIDRDAGALIDQFGVSNLARRYLEVFPDQTIVRVVVRPGEAYVAPTENLIHDGHAPAGSDPDLSLTIRGRFLPVAGAAASVSWLRFGRDEAA